MKVYIILALIVFIYYQYHIRYPLQFYQHVYLSIFIGGVLLIKYCMNYQKPLMYKMMNNVQNTNNIRLHELVPDFHNKPNSIKYKLAEKQEFRCESCKNNIDINYIDYYKLSYKIPLQYGGTNDVTNLCIICPNCYKRLIN